MKKLTRTLTYAASLETVGAMLDDRTFREAVLERQRVARGSVEIAGDVVTIEQARSSEHIPHFARTFIGDEIVIVQKETWTSATHADVELTIPGKPAQAVGTLILTESGGTTTETVDLAVSVRIPLIGGKIEAMFADMVELALDREHEVGTEWLAR